LLLNFSFARLNFYDSSIFQTEPQFLARRSKSVAGQCWLGWRVHPKIQFGTGAMPNFVGLRTTVRWIKNNPVYSLVCIAASIFGFVAGVPRAWVAVSEALNIPLCVTYSDVYYGSDSHFKKEKNGRWTEYQSTAKLQFDEIARARDYITLVNRTPRADPRANLMLLRLPTCGGTVQWTYQNPMHWNDHMQVFRNASPAVVAEHATWEKIDSARR
jgi:hypothetical protein